MLIFLGNLPGVKHVKSSLEGKRSMRKRRIVMAVIKEADGGFGVLGHPGAGTRQLIAAQADSWEEVQERALDAVNHHLQEKGQGPVAAADISYSFDLPSFFDAYPQLPASALVEQGVAAKSQAGKAGVGRKKPADRKLHRIVEAVAQLGTEVVKIPA
ncbi:hypothetical protein ADICEAN_03521 [Cesiribacter andamanensis AMV16]|uniref:Uncharacterized protein n=2 Tax=Cesiribacter TaxID=1133570 RepID=M7N2A7_9BACT|nr:hypothetical protein ADICEAN_03521 [Cesiribacter andamanensis AMV16]